MNNPVDINRYRYAASNPVNAFDPTGHGSIMEYVVARLPGSLSATSPYVEERAEESFFAATLNAAEDYAIQDIAKLVLQSTELSPLAEKAFGGFLADVVITVSSARAIDRNQDEIAIALAAKGDGEGAVGVYTGAERKNLGAISGYIGEHNGKGDWLSPLIALVQEIWSGAEISESVEPNPSMPGVPDRCRYHAEQKVVQEADGQWEILGIGASNPICLACQAAIEANSPAAIMVPIGGNATCLP